MCWVGVGGRGYGLGGLGVGVRVKNGGSCATKTSHFRSLKCELGVPPKFLQPRGHAPGLASRRARSARRETSHTGPVP